MSEEVLEDDDEENLDSLWIKGFTERENIRRIKRTLRQERNKAASLKFYYQYKAQREAEREKGHERTIG